MDTEKVERGGLKRAARQNTSTCTHKKTWVSFFFFFSSVGTSASLVSRPPTSIRFFLLFLLLFWRHIWVEEQRKMSTETRFFVQFVVRYGAKYSNPLLLAFADFQATVIQNCKLVVRFSANDDCGLFWTTITHYTVQNVVNYITLVFADF